MTAHITSCTEYLILICSIIQLLLHLDFMTKSGLVDSLQYNVLKSMRWLTFGATLCATLLACMLCPPHRWPDHKSVRSDNSETGANAL